MSFGKVSMFEHTFWLQVLGDHARFIFYTLSPAEAEYIQQAQHFIQLNDHLLEQARQMKNASDQNWTELAQHAYSAAESIRQFKLQIISVHLSCEIDIALTPTFLNHMVNEVEEYLRILTYLIRGEVPPILHPVHHHNIWLLDAAGHAAAIKGDIDPVEKKVAKKAEAFQTTFEDFYIKAREMAGFIRARQDLFPALQQFNADTSLEITLFYHFLEELEEMRLDCRRLGTLMPLMADHMAREECYYLIKLHEVDPTNVKITECDPTKPRTQQV
ncbi:DUF2935 domain-containing protein [Caldalkalibacillus salinus]|uniref:DUF2935 domain-containing protein n=1 Tax=Caldalkalibacillus salinus TaxID=2803787 RepID=UPI001F3CB91C|nr:DUF2935 domain-containing protein [Caldalkalibacillus salinus]